MRVFTPLWSAMLVAMASTSLHAMTLTEAIQSTLDNHPEIAASTSSRLVADQDVKVARGDTCLPWTCSPAMDANIPIARRPVCPWAATTPRP